MSQSINSILPPENPNSIVDKIRSDASQVFDYGDTPGTSSWKYALEALGKRPIPERELLVAGFSALRAFIPRRITDARQERAFGSLPLKNTNGSSEGHLLKKIGRGGINTVYFVSSSAEVPNVAVGLRRDSFRSPEDAIAYAAFQSAEVSDFKEIYRSIPGLVPDEQNIVHRRPNGQYGVMFLKPFIHGEIRDVFRLPQDELISIFQNNPRFRQELTDFTNITNSNRERLIGERQIDTLGENNFAVVGPEGNEHLCIIDAHYIYKPDDPEIIDNVSAHIDYLTSIVSQN